MADLSGIVFDDDVSAVGPADVDGLFDGWPRVPSAERFLRDAELVPYYERFGMLPVSGMVMRDPAAL